MIEVTPQQEIFAQAVVSGKNQSDAYREAYKVKPTTKPETVQANASRLMSDSKVSARVAELRAPVVAKAQMTLEGHLADLQMLRDKALQADQFSAAISAEIARGKASGVHVEKSEQHLTGAVSFVLEVAGVEPTQS
jgi:hypothetical protein